MNTPNGKPNGVNLVVRGLRKSFNGQEVIKGIDFEVQPGEIFVIMGPSGSGKSVLLKHLIGLEPADAGDILINNEPITNPEIAAKYRMALVFQSGALLSSLTVGENVGLYLAEHRLKSPEEIRRIVAEKLADVGLKDVLDLNRRTGVTSLVVSHDRDLAFGVASRIAIISEGRILTIGTPDEVKQFKHPLVQQFLHADFKRES